MRNVIIIMHALILCVIFTGCSSPSSFQGRDAIINEAELTNFEGQLINTITERSFVYDMELNNETITEIQVTIDVYEHGELVNTVVNMGSSFSEEERKGDIRLVIMQQLFEENEESQWIGSIMTETGRSSFKSSKNKLDKQNQFSSTVWGGINSETSIDKGTKTVLASIANSDKSVISSIGNIETEEQLKQATNYEQVFIISVTLN